MAATQFFPARTDRMLYFVLADFGAHGLAWVERCPSVMGQDATVRDIREGQIENVVQVLECCLDGPICFDRTEDILKLAGRWDFDPPSLSPSERLEAMRDHVRDHRKVPA